MNDDFKEENVKHRTIDNKKLSKPLTPDDIPPRSKNMPRYYKKSINEYSNALDIDPKQGLWFYLKVPSIIFVAIFISYLLGRFKFSLVHVFIIGYTVYFIYKRRVKHFSNTLKSLINESVRIEKSKYVGESVEWLNYIIGKFWKVAEPIISSDVYQIVNRELLKVCPPFLNDLKLTEFTLGSRAPVIEQVTYHSSNDNSVILDLSVAFVPLQTSDDAIQYFLGENKQWNSKIILKARLGSRNRLGLNLPISLVNISFRGRIRVVINLVPANNFIKDVEVCLMDVPDFDFTLVPLKTVDIMDIPGLSTWINKTIIYNLKQLIINPNSITIDVEKIAQSMGHDTHVVLIQILSLDNEEDDKLVAEIDLDGMPLFTTNQKMGRNMVFNEYFYAIVQNIDEKVGISLYNQDKYTGSLMLSNEGFNKIRLNRDEHTYAYLNTNLSKFKITDRVNNSAIVTLKIIGAENILSLDNERGEIYSSFCSVIVSPLNQHISNIPLDFIKNTSSAAPLIVSGVLRMEEDEINNVQAGNESTSMKLLPSTGSTFYIFESKRVFNNNSPNYNESFKFFCRDLEVDCVSICIINDRNSEIIGRIGVKMSDVISGKPIKYKLKDARSGKMEVQFDLAYINLINESKELFKFNSVQKVTVETVSENGIFYGVLETKNNSFIMDPFTSSLPIKKSIYVPVHNNDQMWFKLYKETTNGDVYLGKEELRIEDGRVGLVLKDNVSVTLRIQGEVLEDYKGSPSKKENLKIMQIKLGEFYNFNEEVFVEFRNNDGVILCSKFSRNKRLDEIFTILNGKEDLYALIKNADQGENRILGRFTIPQRHADEKMVLNEYGLAVEVKTKIQTCSFNYISNLKKGYLEVYIKSAKNLKSSERGSVNAYVKILVNDNNVFKTKSAKESNDPIFYESFVMPVDKIRDVFTIQIYDSYSSSKNSLLHFLEFPLHNINEGFSEVEFHLTDSKSFKKSGASIRIGFNFCRDASTLKVKKRGILGEFFGF